MVDQQRLQSALRRFASTLVRRYEVGDVLYRLSDTVSDVLGVTGSGVSILDDDVLRFVTATNEAVAEVERLQDHYAQGPCKDSVATATSVVIDDLAAHRQRWPKFAPAAVDRGLSAALGIPMHVDGTTVGALNVYNATPRAWTDEEVTAAQVLADMATAYVVMVGQLRSAEQLAEQLQHALDSRIVIEQAKGALARDHDLDVSVAFELLRRHARNNNRNIHDVAAEVVDGTLHL